MTIAIIPARGGSKSIPKKNLYNFCGKPLIAWSIEQAKNASCIDRVIVTSDCDEILDVSAQYGAEPLKRPGSISGDTAKTEDAISHVLDNILKDPSSKDVVFLLQATSPVRTTHDLEMAYKKFLSSKCDSLFSGAVLEDFLIWEKASDNLRSMNYDFTNRSRRQDRAHQFVENGSFYIFDPVGFRKHQNRLYGNIGIYEMDFWKTFEIDSFQDIKFCEVLMRGFLL